LVGRYFPNTQTFGLWTITAFFFSIAVAVIVLLVCGGICGYTAAPSKDKALRISIQYAAKCTFEGWKIFNDTLEKAELELHVQSKQALAIYAYELHDTVAYTKVTGKDPKAFVRYFKSVAAHALYSFFQHSKDSHPDYCACYFKWNAATQNLSIVASVSGSDSYAVNDSKVLGPGSFAHRAVIDARPYVWPDQAKELKMKKLVPPIVRDMKRFIVIPVYRPAMPRDASTCLGVLSVDSNKAGFHFTDKYHVDVLKLLAAAVGELDQTLL
jgi:hypothetical protein